MGICEYQDICSIFHKDTKISILQTNIKKRSFLLWAYFSSLHSTVFPVQLSKFTLCNKINLTADSVWWRLHAASSWCPWLLQHRRPLDSLYTNTHIHTYFRVVVVVVP